MSQFKRFPRLTTAVALIAFQVAISMTYFLLELFAPQLSRPAWPVWLAQASTAVLVLLGLSMVWSARPTGKAKEKARKRFLSNLRERPAYSVLMVFAAGLLFVAAPAGILYHMIFAPFFLPSLELRGFAYASSIVVGALGLLVGVVTIRNETPSREDKEQGALRRGLMRIGIVLFTPVLLAVMWMIFLQGPVSFVLHTFAAKETRWTAEAVARTDTSGLRDFTCQSFWKAKLSDSTFWWPRDVCGITRDGLSPLRNGGVIELHGTVSRFGIHYDSYKVR